MIQQVIINKNDYDEIENIIAEHNEMKEIISNFEQVKKVLVEHEAIKKQLHEIQKCNDEFEEFKEIVAKMFLDEEGKFSYYETVSHYRNKLYLNPDIAAHLFNYFFEYNFFKDSGLKVESDWKFIG